MLISGAWAFSVRIIKIDTVYYRHKHISREVMTKNTVIWCWFHIMSSITYYVQLIYKPFSQTELTIPRYKPEKSVILLCEIFINKKRVFNFGVILLLFYIASCTYILQLLTFWLVSILNFFLFKTFWTADSLPLSPGQQKPLLIWVQSMELVPIFRP